MIRNALITLAFALIAAPAMAHVSLEQPEAKLGATYKAVLRVPHGCGALATQTLRVQIPEGFFNVKPMPKAGWTLETVKGKYAKAYVNHGTEVTEGVQEIVWSGGDLPDEFYDEFVFRGTFAGDLPVGATVYFPVVQECAGAQEDWIDTSGDDKADKPAPGVVLIEGTHH